MLNSKARSNEAAYTATAELLHLRAGHLGKNATRVLIRSGAVVGLGSVTTAHDPASCAGCIAGKQRRVAFAHGDSDTRVMERIGQQVCFDIFGPTRATTREGARYCLLGLDRYSDFVFADLLKTKDGAAAKIIFICKNAANRLGKHFEELHTDGGGEFQGKNFVRFLRDSGISWTNSLPYTAQHNAHIERKIRTICESARSMLQHAGAAAELWGDAVLSSVFIHNRVTITRDTGKTPVQLWNQSERAPSLENLRVWGCDAYELRLKPNKGDKFDSKSILRMFIGYGQAEPPNAGYKLLDVNTGQVSWSRDVRFAEASFTQSAKYKHGLQDGPESAEDGSLDDFFERTTWDNDTRAAIKWFNPAPPRPTTAPIVTTPVASPLRNGLDKTQQSRAQGGDGAESVGSEGNALAESRSVDEPPSPSPPVDSEEPASRGPAVPTDMRAAIGKRESRPPSKLGMIDSRDMGSRIDALPSSSLPSPPTNSRYSLRARPSAQPEPAVKGTKKKKTTANLAETSTIYPPEPLTFSQSQADNNESIQWKESVMSELSSLERHGTWRAIDPSELPAGRKPIPSKFVFKRKLNPDNTIARHKARLVVQGFRQRAGIDYNETFAPVLRYTTLLVLLGMANHFDLDITHMDVETAFLNAKLTEEIYIKLPPGIDDLLPHLKGKVLRLLKSLYGLKQAPIEWGTLFANSLKNLGLKPIQSDPCVFVKTSKSGRLLIIAVFVDDIIVFNHIDDREEAAELKAQLQKLFTIKDLGSIKVVLGMRITRDRTCRKLQVDQEQYVNSVLSAYGFSECRPVATPALSASHSSEESQTPTNTSEDEHYSTASNHPQVSISNYSSVVGAIQYAAHSTRPDLAFAASQLSRDLASPSDKSVVEAKRVLRYMAGTRDLKLTFSVNSNDLELTAYSDSDWGNDPTDARSRTGQVLKLGGGPVSWQSRKQSIVALSSTEAEYIAMGETGREVIWLRSLLSELGCAPSRPTPLWVDNRTAIGMALDGNGSHSRRKHINVRHHWIREAISQGIIEPHWISTVNQQADLFTKGLGRIAFERCRSLVMGQAADDGSESNQDN
jgi:hypothetical protein